MELEKKKKLTREWVMVMLYKNPMTMDSLVMDGCDVMVYGWELPDFRDIIVDMTDEENPPLRLNTGNNAYSLTTDGIFYIKKHALIPLIQITENAELLDTFVKENKNRCNTDFLLSLSKTTGRSPKENIIKEFAKNHYADIAQILYFLIPYLLGNS